MSRKHSIVVDFGDAEVRRRSQASVPKFLREWESIPDVLPVEDLEWKKLPRRPCTPGYPPFDIFRHWIMDFATISAGQLGRSDWKNFRRMLLLHVPDCPLFCWYCFNDAWRECAHIKVDNMEASKIVGEFKRYRQDTLLIDGYHVNILRISGGEPFIQPLLICDVANEFRSQFKEDFAFLWVDTNLVPLTKAPSDEIRETLAALSALGERAAIHACIHGGGDKSFLRNTCETVSLDQIEEALRQLLEARLLVYPRVNAVGLTPSEVESVFRMLAKLPEHMPLKTYLGPIELLYEHALDRMRAFQGLSPLFAKSLRRLPKGKKGSLPSFRPPNAAIFTWNRLLEDHYGVGYAQVPRHMMIGNKRAVLPQVPKRQDHVREWQDLILLCKGWEKEVYALKTLELLSVPKGAIVEVEYENKWIEPTFLAHVFSCPEFYKQAGTKVLSVATYRARMPGVIPLRWGVVRGIGTADCRDENHALNLRIEVGDYAHDFSQRFLQDKRSTLFEQLARYVGASNLPFASKTCYFCQYVGLEILPRRDDDFLASEDAAFKSVVLDIVRKQYEKARPDVYFRIKTIRNRRTSMAATLENGILRVDEGDAVEVIIEACNPNLGNPGYPQVQHVEICVASTEDDCRVSIAPEHISLSKYGESCVQIRFSRSGEFRGDLLFQPVMRDVRIPSFRIPFVVKLRKT